MATGKFILPLSKTENIAPPEDYNTYLTRDAVEAGTMESNNNTYTIIKGLKDIYGNLNNHKLIWCGDMGYKKRTSGVNNYATKGYSSNPISLGAEVIANGGFDSATGWVLSSHRTISGGLLHFINANGWGDQAYGYAFDKTKRYKITYNSRRV